MFCCSVVVLEIRLFTRSGLWSTTFLLVLVSVSDKENSGFYFTIGQDHDCRDDVDYEKRHLELMLAQKKSSSRKISVE